MATDKTEASDNTYKMFSVNRDVVTRGEGSKVIMRYGGGHNDI